MAYTATTQYGFIFGAADVKRLCSDDKTEWVFLSIETPRKTQGIKIYVTRTGKLRVYRNGKEML